jgi:hypothetical protein
MADGGRISVEHQHFVALQPSGRELVVYQDDDSPRILDVMLITRLEVNPKSAAAARKRAA